MVRPGASTPSKKKDKEAGATVEDKAEEAESKRLKDLAFYRKLLSRNRSHVDRPSLPSKTILKSDGKDIVKKGHRKSKYLFAFPGLMAPLAGGKLGDLTNLDSRNPILYVEFPQGRLKLFGTIVYPKNKYLTLQFQKGAGNVVCEDCFESLIVFSNVWWIGTKEQNPEEVRLPLPRSFEQDKSIEIDFTAGAGQTKNFNKNKEQLEKSENNQTIPKAKPEVSEVESISKENDVPMNSPPIRQSARTAGKILKYIDSTSDSEGSDSDKYEHSTHSVEPLKSGAREEISDGEDINKHDSAGSTKTEEGRFGKSTPMSKDESPKKLKQSRLELFCRTDPQEITAARSGSTVDSKDVIGSAIKTKRPWLTLQDTEGSQENGADDDDDDDDDIQVIKRPPSKRRKQVKEEQGAGTPKTALKSTTKNTSASKDGRAKKPNLTLSKSPAAVSSPKAKGRKAAPRASKSLKEESSDYEEESDPVASDDSDEDYVG